jgi:hypothetical protein
MSAFPPEYAREDREVFESNTEVTGQTTNGISLRIQELCVSFRFQFQYLDRKAAKLARCASALWKISATKL